jgi:hypothetical protein
MTRRTFLAAAAAATPPTEIAIDGNRFLINGAPTYKGRSWRGHKIEGLLMNTRMVNGIFDDRNPESRSNFNYPDTNAWDPNRNTREFVAAMPEWRRHGVLSFNVNMQGGNPRGYAPKQPWITGAFLPNGDIIPEYLNRLRLILDKANELGMAPQLGVFYFGQDQVLESDAAVRRALRNTIEFVLTRDYKHVLLEVANECNNSKYDQPLLKQDLIPLLMKEARSITVRRRRLLVGTSFNGNTLPPEAVTEVSDFILLHGNGVKDPNRIREMVRQVRKQQTYRNQPVLFNEDDHFDFDKPDNNYIAAVSEYASWGIMDVEGYQTVPVNWGIDTARKRGFFDLTKEMTGA